MWSAPSGGRAAERVEPLTGSNRGRTRRDVAARALIALALAALPGGGCGGGDHAAERDEAVRRAEEIAGVARQVGPLPDGALRAAIDVSAPPAVMRAGERATVRVRVRNAGDSVWPARGREDGYFQVNLGNIWRDAAGRTVEDADYVRSNFPTDVRPGEEVELSLSITAPKTPGTYELEFDLVQEMVVWFSEKGSESFKTTVRVE